MTVRSIFSADARVFAAARGVLGSVLCGVFVLACLDEAEPLQCPKIQPTGGNVQGRWELMDFCMDAPAYHTAACPAMKEQIVGLSATGYIEYGANGVSVADARFVVGRRLEIPRSCVAPRSCFEVGQAYIKREGLNETQAFCRGTDVCVCAVRQINVLKGSSGYRVEGRLLHEEGNPTPLEFSVVGNELRLQNPGVLIRLARF